MLTSDGRSPDDDNLMIYAPSAAVSAVIILLYR